MTFTVTRKSAVYKWNYELTQTLHNSTSHLLIESLLPNLWNYQQILNPSTCHSVLISAIWMSRWKMQQRLILKKGQGDIDKRFARDHVYPQWYFISRTKANWCEASINKLNHCLSKWTSHPSRDLSTTPQGNVGQVQKASVRKELRSTLALLLWTKHAVLLYTYGLLNWVKRLDKHTSLTLAGL